jgi:outer membrane protein OmpA-like peptidoglycan-associated protein
MTRNILMIGAIALLWAAPAQTQQRGTVEFGAFGSVGQFDKTLTLDKAFGGGGRVGIYLDPRWSVEFEKGEMRSTRTLGLADVNVGLLAARVLVRPIHSGAFSMHIGAGAGGSTETNFLHSYGLNALAGIKFDFNDVVGVRFDVASDWLAHYDWKSYQRLQGGLTFSRRPHNRVQDVEVVRAVAPACNCVQMPDSVSADEQARRRRVEQDYRNLRDSLSRNPPVAPAAPSSLEARLTMEEQIQFEFNRSDLSPAARTILDAKVPVFRANPTMTIMITGHTGNMGTENYNEALGNRRSAAARDYLIAQGIDGSRITLDSKGETQPVVAPAAVGISANAPNRRDMFRLVIVPDVIKKP